MIYPKTYARKKILNAKETIENFTYGLVCEFHTSNPDQVGMESCKNCIIIRDICLCDGQMGCDICGEPL